MGDIPYFNARIHRILAPRTEWGRDRKQRRQALSRSCASLVEARWQPGGGGGRLRAAGGWEAMVADLESTLGEIATARRADPLAPVTVCVPSHAAGLQLRRRLAGRGPFAGVRFETAARLAEMIAAGALAADGRLPLARPIGDYAARQVARTAREPFTAVRDMDGFARILRQIFARLRRGGITADRQVQAPLDDLALREVLRLYGEYRSLTARFYDAEDLLDAAARVAAGGGGNVRDLGRVYIVPPAPVTAAGQAFVGALARRCELVQVEEHGPAAGIVEHFVLMPDQAAEVREAVRRVVALLEAGAGLHEVAVFHGAGREYRQLLADAFAAAGVTANLLPGALLSETPAGRAALQLAQLPATDYSRTAVSDLLAAGALRHELPGAAAPVRVRASAWDRVSRRAGVTRGLPAWARTLTAFDADLAAEIAARRAADGSPLPGAETEIAIREGQRASAAELRDVLTGLARALEPLRERQPAARFIDAFLAAFRACVHPGTPGFAEVEREIAQLGTVDAIGGEFDLAAFAAAFAANLDAAFLREGSLGQGVLVGEHRLAAGLAFDHVILCGAAEGYVPAGSGADPLLGDARWRTLKALHPAIEDAAARDERAQAAAVRAIACARRSFTWSAPLYEPGGAREYYPCALMAAHASVWHGEPLTSAQLRTHGGAAWLTRAQSPLDAMVRGPGFDAAEAALRRAVALRQAVSQPGPDHPRARPVALLRARAEGAFSEWDGNLTAMARARAFTAPATASPTSLEAYATCGFRYFCASVLGLRELDNPEERETMDPAARGTVVHDALERFFRQMRERGRPRAGEAWTMGDRETLLALAREELDRASARGLAGLDLFLRHETRTIEDDLAQFLDRDTEFRVKTGAVPREFEYPIPETTFAGVRFRGRADRIDVSDDGSQAWVIDYKTGRSDSYKGLSPESPFHDGRFLQLPAYSPAARAVARAAGATDPLVSAVYWFITRRGEFKQIEYADTAANRERFEATLRAILDGIARGAFPAVPGEPSEWRNSFDNCTYCDFDRICPQGRGDAHAGRQEHADLRPWLTVGDTARGAGDGT